MNKKKLLEKIKIGLVSAFLIGSLVACQSEENNMSTANITPNTTQELSTVDETPEIEESDKESSSLLSKQTIEEIENNQQNSTEENINESKEKKENPSVIENTAISSLDLNKLNIPEYSGNPYVIINNNVPYFLDSELTTNSYEFYSPLDNLGRCGVVYACVGKDIMPNEERGSIGQVKPTGWQTVKYDIVDGKYLYNRCHLIGFQLTGENANTQNLITGTRYMNVEGMLPFENMVADYIQETENHVMYRVTPIFKDNNLLASGVLIEAKSVEDNGEDILICVYCYNVQPGIDIDYTNGNNSLNNSINQTSEQKQNTVNQTQTNNPPKSETQPEPTPDSTPQPESTPNTGSEIIVWKSATGEKYHSINNCGKMNPAKASQLTESQAISMGLGKCSKCW